MVQSPSRSCTRSRFAFAKPLSDGGKQSKENDPSPEFRNMLLAGASKSSALVSKQERQQHR